jgi:hypothetical protein
MLVSCCCVAVSAALTGIMLGAATPNVNSAAVKYAKALVLIDLVLIVYPPCCICFCCLFFFIELIITDRLQQNNHFFKFFLKKIFKTV